MSSTLYNYKIDLAISRTENEIILCDLLNAFHELTNNKDKNFQKIIDFVVDEIHEYSLIHFPCICIRPTCNIHKILLEGCIIVLSIPYVYTNSTYVIKIIKAMTSIMRCHNAYSYFIQYTILQQIMMIHLENAEVQYSIIQFLDVISRFSIHYKTIPQTPLMNTILYTINYHINDPILQLSSCIFLSKLMITISPTMDEIIIKFFNCLTQTLSVYPHNEDIQYFICKIFKNIPLSYSTPMTETKTADAFMKAFPYLLQILCLHENNESLTYICLDTITYYINVLPEVTEYIKNDQKFGLKLFCHILETHFYSYATIYNILPIITILADDSSICRRMILGDSECMYDTLKFTEINECVESTLEADEVEPISSLSAFHPSIIINTFGYHDISRVEILRQCNRLFPDASPRLMRSKGYTNTDETRESSEFEIKTFNKQTHKNEKTPSVINISSYMGLLLEHYTIELYDNTDLSDKIRIFHNLSGLWNLYTKLTKNADNCTDLLLSPAYSTLRKLNVFSRALDMIQKTSSWSIKSSARNFIISLAKGFPYNDEVEWTNFDSSWEYDETNEGKGTNNLRLNTSLVSMADDFGLIELFEAYSLTNYSLLRNLIYVGENDSISMENLAYFAKSDSDINTVCKLMVFTGVKISGKDKNIFQQIEQEIIKLSSIRGYIYDAYSHSVDLSNCPIIAWEELDVSYSIIQKQITNEYNAFVSSTFTHLPLDMCRIITEFVKGVHL
jgi:hypothetical protein